MFKKYYYVVKPGIIYGNTLSVVAGYLLASHWHKLWLVLPTILGVGLIIGSACVFNNLIDRDIDAKMSRTKKRALVVNSISAKNAIIYASSLGVLGVLILLKFTNLLTVAVGIIGFIDYVFFYGYAKRRTHHATLIGSISGATPLVAGYTAYTNRIDTTAVILFAIMTFWQMPHFYAIALRRSKDYASANIPVLPLAKNVRETKVQILIYISLFVLSCMVLTLTGATGIIFLVVTLILGLGWLKLALRGFNSKNDEKWAKELFLFSLIVLLGLSFMLSIGGLIP